MTDDDPIAWMRTCYPRLFEADGTPKWHKVDKPIERDADFNAGVRAADDLSAFVGEAVSRLLDSVDDITRIFAAAPIGNRPKRRRRREFDARNPCFIEQRHQMFLDGVNASNFTAISRENGLTAQEGSMRRAELNLLFLLDGKYPSWSVLNAKRRKGPRLPEEPVICAAAFKPLWEAHEDDLDAAEVLKLYRERVEFPPLSARAKLVIGFWKACTLLKQNQGHELLDYRDLWQALGNIVDFVRAEHQRR